ncbi:MAG TPA: hypothetical protein GX534_07720 [Thermoanaerobacterales bacterium]|nr:hypothetical protein [Thermoanaerobacterales bacterium]
MYLARQAKKRYQKKIMSIDNVIGVGVGYKSIRGEVTDKPAVLVFVKKKISKKELPKRQIIPQILDETLTDVIEIGEIRLLNSRTEKTRPARPGMSIGHYKVTAGTIGAVVRDEKTGDELILSNNHVLANATNGRDKKSFIGDDILQPGSYDGGTPTDVIAHLERFIPIEKDTEKTNCLIAQTVEKLANWLLRFIRPNYNMIFTKTMPTYNLIDAALAKPVKPEYISPDIMGLGSVKGQANPNLGMKLLKSGRTTGITSSSVTALDAVLKVLLGPDEEATFYEQIMAGPMARPGDSGSLVVDENMNAVGLLFAGSDKATIINPIMNVLKLLKVTL